MDLTGGATRDVLHLEQFETEVRGPAPDDGIGASGDTRDLRLIVPPWLLDRAERDGRHKPEHPLIREEMAERGRVSRADPLQHEVHRSCPRICGMYGAIVSQAHLKSAGIASAKASAIQPPAKQRCGIVRPERLDQITTPAKPSRMNAPR